MTARFARTRLSHLGGIIDLMDSIVIIILAAVALAAVVAAAVALSRLARVTGAPRPQTELTPELLERFSSLETKVQDGLAYADKSMQERFGNVDKSMVERLGNVDNIVESQVGGMSKSLGHQVKTMNAELSQVRKLVTDLQKDRASQSASIDQRLRSLTEEQAKLFQESHRRHKDLQETTGDLKNLLSGSQARGQWGERMAEDVIRAAGLSKKTNYRKQVTLYNPDGSAGRPDFTFMLPGSEKVLHMDVKFPFASYRNYLEAEDEPSRQSALKLFGTAVQKHVKETSERFGYKALDSTPGYVLMFIANDGVYSFLHEHYPDSFDHALKAGVVICSPVTLIPVLMVINQAFDTLAIRQSSQEIFEVLAKFDKQWTTFTEAMELVEKQLRTVSKSFAELTGVRKRELQKKLDRVVDLRKPSGHGTLEPGSSPAPLMPPSGAETEGSGPD